jgi:DNA-binding XRE family transcriptional regulator
MSKPQIIKTPDGGEMVVLDRATFDRLTEAATDADDRAAAAEIDRKLAAGEEEAIPAEFADRLIDGESPVRVWRDLRGLTAQALANMAGVDRATVSLLETGRRSGNVETMKALAVALGVAIDDLV